MKKPYISPEYTQRLDSLAETLTTDRRNRLGLSAADLALEDTVEMTVITDQMLFDYDAEHLVRGEE